MKRPEDRVLLNDMVDHARVAVEAIRDRDRLDLEKDPVLAAALERFVEVIGEAASKVSRPTRDEMLEIPWQEIIGMRHRLVHGYSSVDHDIVWDVVSQDLPSLIDRLEQRLSRSKSEG